MTSSSACPSASSPPSLRDPLLGPDDAPAYELLNVHARRPVLLVCDHASRRIPRKLAGLGLSAAASVRHIAWDIGAGELVRALAERLGAPAVLAGYSRLVVDCNRPLHDPTSMAPVSDGEPVPGNVGLTAEQRQARVRECFVPYHEAIEATLARLGETGCAPALIAVHSFTPIMGGVVRPWHCGVLWDRDPRIPVPLIQALRAESGLVVGDNQPYSGRHPSDYTIDVHAESRGLPHVCLEIRQDLIADPAGVAAWAERLYRVLTPILADPALYRVLSMAGESRE